MGVFITSRDSALPRNASAARTDRVYSRKGYRGRVPFRFVEAFFTAS